MDLDAEFDRAVSDMKWGEVISTLQSAIEVLFGDMSYPRPPPPPPPYFTPYPWPRPNFHHRQPGYLKEQYFQPCCIYEGANPLMSAPKLNWIRQTNPVIYHNSVYDPDFMQPCYFHNHPEQQPLQYMQPPVNYIPMNAMESNLSPLAYPYDNVSACSPSNGLQTIQPPVKNCVRRRSRPSRDRSEPYVKKPLNAFMLFLKEQRAKVLAGCDNINSATFAKFVGRTWASMSNEQKARYYAQYQVERRLHSLQNPGWSCTENYGEKKKKI